MQSRLDEQDVTLRLLTERAALTTQPDAKQDTSSAWSEVVKRPKRPTAAVNNPKNITKTEAPKLKKAKKPGILIKTSEEEFPALAKTLHSAPIISAEENKIVAMRKTKSGDMLVEVDGDAATVSAVKGEIARVAGERAIVRELSRSSVVEIRDVDSWSDKNDLLQALVVETGITDDDLKVISFRKGYGGTRVAAVLLPLPVTYKLVEKGKVRVGLVNCRVRLGEKRTRCFKCLAMGHLSRDCTGPSRVKCCC